MSNNISIKTQKVSFTGWLLFCVLSFIWGGAFVLIQEGNKVFTPMQVASVRIGVGFLVMIPILITHYKKIIRKELPVVVVGGFVGSLIPAFLFAKAQTVVSSVTAGILAALTPAFTVILGRMFFGHSISRRKMGGIVLGFMGAISLSFLTKGGEFSLTNPLGLLIIGATMCYGINLNLLKFKVKETPPLAIASASLLIVGPIAILYLFNTNFLELAVKPENQKAVWSLLLLGTTATGLAIILFNKLLKVVPPEFASATTYAMPLVSFFIGFFAGDQITTFHFVGMAVIMFSIVLINSSK